MKILFFGKYNCKYSMKLLNLMKNMNWEILDVWSRRQREKIPQNVQNWKGDYIFCFRSYYILKKNILSNAKIASINFHPAPPSFRGSGAINRALEKNETVFGATCHHIDEKIDNGNIIDVEFLKIIPDDNLNTLLPKAHKLCFELACKTIKGIKKKGVSYIKELEFKNKKIKWSGPLGFIKDVNTKQIVSPEISYKDLNNRIRSYHNEIYPLKINLHGFEFILNLKDK